jgi:hypothetical protein
VTVVVTLALVLGAFGVMISLAPAAPSLTDGHLTLAGMQKSAEATNAYLNGVISGVPRISCEVQKGSAPHAVYCQWSDPVVNVSSICVETSTAGTGGAKCFAYAPSLNVKSAGNLASCTSAGTWSPDFQGLQLGFTTDSSSLDTWQVRAYAVTNEGGAVTTGPVSGWSYPTAECS